MGISVTTIGGWAFDDCTNLETLYCLAKSAPTLVGEYAFFNTSKVTLYVPRGSKADYKKQDGWKAFGKIIAMRRL